MPPNSSHFLLGISSTQEIATSKILFGYKTELKKYPSLTLEAPLIGTEDPGYWCRWTGSIIASSGSLKTVGNFCPPRIAKFSCTDVFTITIGLTFMTRLIFVKVFLEPAKFYSQKLR